MGVGRMQGPRDLKKEGHKSVPCRHCQITWGTAGLPVPIHLRLWCGGRAAISTGLCFAGWKVSWFVNPSCSTLVANSTQAWGERAQGHHPQPQVLLLPVKTARGCGASAGTEASWERLLWVSGRGGLI